MKVSFAFPVLNEESRLVKCLSSIKSQNYPQDLLEIIVADGGSTDESVSIINHFGGIVVNNPDRLAEPGGVLAHETASGDIKIFFAADNVLPHDNWVSELVDIFSKNPDIMGVYTHIIVDEFDAPLNKYYSELHVEPFTYSIYKNHANPRFFNKLFTPRKFYSNYIDYDFKISEHPLIAFAQGFAVRGNYIRPGDTIMDDVEPFLRLVESKSPVVYAPSLGVYHYHLSTFSSYISKFKNRIDNTLGHSSFGVNSRGARLTKYRKFKKYQFVFEGLLLITPLIESIFLILSRRRPCMILHFPASVLLAYLILFRYINHVVKKIL